MAFETSSDPGERKKILRLMCIVYLLALLPAWFFTSIGNIGLGIAVWLGCVFLFNRGIRRADKEVLANKTEWEALRARRDSLLRKAQMKIYPETRLECFALLEEIDQIQGLLFDDPENHTRNMETLADYRNYIELDLSQRIDQMS